MSGSSDTALEPELVLEDRPCPLGCPRDDERLFSARDRQHGLPGEFHVVRCRGCGLMRTNPRPDPSAMQRYYPEDYGPHQTRASAEAARSRLLAAVERSLWSLRRRWVRDELLPPLEPGRLLEVGCAGGGFLRRMQARGWQVSGIEASANAAERARALGLAVHLGPVETAPEPAEPLDLCVLWMSLEHLHEPVEVLSRLHGWSKAGAWLAVSTPNAASVDFTLFREHAFALQVPTHLYHFTPTTLRRVLERSGWDVVRVMHQRSEQNLVLSLGLWAKELGLPRRLSAALLGYAESRGVLRVLLQPLGQPLAWLGHSGRMTLWARKRPE